MTPFLETQRLYLRGLKAEDAPTLYCYRSNPEVSRYQGWLPGSESEALNFIEAQSDIEPGAPGTWFQLAVCLRDHTMIGDLGLHFLADQEKQAEFGISLDPAYQGSGYADEALRAAMPYLFEQCGMHRVFCSIDPRNTASVAMADRLGMRQEGHFVKSIWFRGEWADDVIYALLDDEWPPTKKQCVIDIHEYSHPRETR